MYKPDTWSQLNKFTCERIESRQRIITDIKSYEKERNRERSDIFIMQHTIIDSRNTRKTHKSTKLCNSDEYCYWWWWWMISTGYIPFFFLFSINECMIQLHYICVSRQGFLSLDFYSSLCSTSDNCCCCCFGFS